MNIEIANRLVELRKANNLSQEALAEKLGISRQAVSKWERAEASPDTDNLILLARLYQISLDELLQTDEEILTERERQESNVETKSGGEDVMDSLAEDKAEQAESMQQEQTDREQDSRENEEYVHVGFQGIHVKDKDGEVHVGWNGIHVMDTKDEVHIDKNGVYVNGEEVKDHLFKHHRADFPIGLIAIVTYIILGCACDLWHPGWLIFLFIPIMSSAIEAVRKKRPEHFAYPVLVVLVFLYVGFTKMLWHPTWVVFLTIPVYYEIIHFIKDRKKP